MLLQPAHVVAPRLLGCLLRRRFESGVTVVKIVETEAYDQDDAASHSFVGKTLRNQTMFGRAGRLYVYRIYGLHSCINVVTGKEGEGSAVLIRAVEPISGSEHLEVYRSARGSQITNGPAKLAQALDITVALQGHDLSLPPLELLLQSPLRPELIHVSKRIGITKEPDRLLRFSLAGNSYLSRRSM